MPAASDAVDRSVASVTRLRTLLRKPGANRQIRAEPRFADLPIFAISASDPAGQQGKLEAAGFTAFSAVIELRDGEPAFGVFLGPYTERPDAVRDRERAQLTPGYGTGRVVQIAR